MKASKLFSGVLGAELQALEQTAQLKAFEAGRSIFQEGDPSDGLYVIVEGKVAITARTGREWQCVLARLGPSDFFGEMGAVDDGPRSATATAEEYSRVYFVHREDLLAAFERFPDLTIGLLREVSARLRDFDHRYAEYAVQAERLTLLERLAQSLALQIEAPLNVIAIEADALDSVVQSVRVSVKDRIRMQVNWTSSVINELLEFNRKTGSKTVFTKTNYARLVKPLIEGMQPELAARSIAIEWESYPPEASVLVDPTRLGHLFKNLIHSACDTMPAGGKIKLRFGQQEQQVVTEIEDTSRGVGPETAALLFEPFATIREVPGANVGLAICKRIVEDHGGRIHARSDDGGTTTFVFGLPLVGKPEPAST